MPNTKRIPPDVVFEGIPCSVTAVGTAMNLRRTEEVNMIIPETLKRDGYLPLKEGNEFIRKYLKVAKRENFKRGQRPRLKDLLASNKRSGIVLVYGHFLYAENEVYYSFFDNDEDEVVSVWWLK